MSYYNIGMYGCFLCGAGGDCGDGATRLAGESLLWGEDKESRKFKKRKKEIFKIDILWCLKEITGWEINREELG